MFGVAESCPPEGSIDREPFTPHSDPHSASSFEPSITKRIDALVLKYALGRGTMTHNTPAGSGFGESSGRAKD